MSKNNNIPILREQIFKNHNKYCLYSVYISSCALKLFKSIGLVQRTIIFENKNL